MDTVTLDDAIETVMKLPPEQQEMLLDILRGRQIAARRHEIAADAEETLAAFHEGRLEPQPLDEILAELDDALEREE